MEPGGAVLRCDLVERADGGRAVAVGRLTPKFDADARSWAKPAVTDLGAVPTDDNDPFVPCVAADGVFVLTKPGRLYHLGPAAALLPRPKLVAAGVRYLVTDPASPGGPFVIGRRPGGWFTARVAATPVERALPGAGDDPRRDVMRQLGSLLEPARTAWAAPPTGR